MPIVFVSANTINHTKLLFLADFQRAIIFQIPDQIKIIISNHNGIPKLDAIDVKNSAMFHPKKLNIKDLKIFVILNSLNSFYLRIIINV
ncbi:hypothetical protein LCGC14_2750330 [marine sediment metagenome]|uniref:Uncharacterized protein n=1 Tax=marine sediment metagenome TaxID=412755 RepID=A0A0F8Z253_9ZZZZ